MGKYAKDGGFYFGKREGLFNKLTHEGVTSNVSRRIWKERPEIDPGREKKGVAGRNSDSGEA